MFDTHQSTIVWQKDRTQKNLIYSRGARQVFIFGTIDKILSIPIDLGKWAVKGTWDTSKKIGGKIWDGTKKVGGASWKEAKKASLKYGKKYGSVMRNPLNSATELFFSPVSYTINKVRQGIGWTLHQTEVATRTAKEIGLGIMNTRDSIARGLGEPLLGPLHFAKHIVVDANRQLLKDVISLPKDIIKTPSRLIEGVRESIDTTRGDISKIIGSATSLKPIETIKNIGSAAKNLITSPFKVAKTTFRPLLNAPINDIKNIGAALWKLFPERISSGIGHIRGGVSRILGSYNTAKSETEVAQSIRSDNAAAKRQAREATQKQEAQDSQA